MPKPAFQNPQHASAGGHVRRTDSWVPLLAVALMAACASTPPPKAELAVAEAAVANADNAGAMQWAPAEMRTAQDKLARAQAAMLAKDHGQAATLAHEANADAQLAAAAARAAKAQREELARKPASSAPKTPWVSTPLPTKPP